MYTCVCVMCGMFVVYMHKYTNTHTRRCVCMCLWCTWCVHVVYVVLCVVVCGVFVMCGYICGVCVYVCLCV